MKKIWIFIILAILVVGYVFYPIVMNFFIKLNNAKIDYSCNVDSDCKINLVGSGICKSDKYRCTNTNSIEGKTEYYRNLFGSSCEAIEITPDMCVCESNKCKSYTTSGSGALLPLT